MTGMDAHEDSDALDAIGVMIGSELQPLVSATTNTVRCAVGAAACPVPPFAMQLVSRRGGETFSIELDVLSLSSPSPWETEFTVAARQPKVWAMVLAELRRGEQPSLDALLPMTRPRPVPPPNQRQLTPGIRAAYVGIGGVILVCGWMIATDLYARMFVATPSSSMIAVDMVTLASPSNGRVVFVNSKTSVSEGEPILGVAQRSGRDVAIESPCDCDVIGRPISIGNLVSGGDTALILAAPGKRPFVSASVDRATLFRLARGASVTLAYGDGVVVSRPLGKIELADSLMQDPAAPNVRLRLDPGREISRGNLGAPVKVSFDTFRGTDFVRFFRPSAPPPTKLAEFDPGATKDVADAVN